MSRRNRPLYQSDASYNQLLVELRSRAASGVALDAYDDTTRGAKNNECSLGLCDDSIEAMMDGVYSRQHHVCPHDSRYFSRDGAKIKEPDGDLNGCFWLCRIFNRRLRDTQDQQGAAYRRIHAVELIDANIHAGDR